MVCSGRKSRLRRPQRPSSPFLVGGGGRREVREIHRERIMEEDHKEGASLGSLKNEFMVKRI